MLYKFISDPNAVQFILAGSIRFTPPRELNDPSELLPLFSPEQVRESLERLRRVGYSDSDMLHLRQQQALLDRLAPRYKAINAPSTKERATAQVRSLFYDHLPLLQKQLEATISEIAGKVGLFCLSRRFDALSMWAYYTANASGLVVEFQDLDSVFKGDETGILRAIRPVEYVTERRGMTFDPQSHERAFLEKVRDWDHEEEVRVILPLDECTATVRPGSSPLHLYSIPKPCIRRLILGWNMPAVDRAKVLDHVRSINPSVEVVRADVASGRVQLRPL